MMNLLNRLKKENIAPVGVTDRVLEWASLALAIVIIALTAVLYIHAPQQVPSHFNLYGEVDGWSDKWIYWGTALLFLGGMLVAYIAAYNHKIVNIPVRWNPDHLPRQLALSGRMSRIMGVLFGLLGIVVQLAMSAAQLGMNPRILHVSIIVVTGLLVINIIVYVTRIYISGRG